MLNKHTVETSILFLYVIALLLIHLFQHTKSFMFHQNEMFWLDFKPFFHFIMLILNAISSILIFQFFRIRWSVCSLILTHVTIDIHPDHHQLLFTIYKFFSDSYSYRHTELLLFRKFYLFSNLLTIKNTSKIVFLSWIL